MPEVVAQRAEKVADDSKDSAAAGGAADLAGKDRDPGGALSKRRERSAVRYNRRRYRTGKRNPDRWWTTEADIKGLQALVGAAQTGELDGQTAQKVTEQQEKSGLAEDGKIGPKTEKVVDLKAESPSTRESGDGEQAPAQDAKAPQAPAPAKQDAGDETAEPTPEVGGLIPSTAKSELDAAPVPESGDPKQLPDQVNQAAKQMGAPSAQLKKAHKQLTAWTYRLMKNPNKRAQGILAKHPKIGKRAFFKKYWRYKCYQFANHLLKRVGGKGKHSVYGMQKRARNAAKGLKKGQTPDVAGRSTKYRGMTAAQLGTFPELKAGTAVHVKMTFEAEKPYHKADDFHHWFVYVGGGIFSDSRGALQPGAKIDNFLKAWVKRGFGSKKFNYKHLYTERFATEKSLQRKRPRPKPNVQPLVTAVYNPEDSKAGVKDPVLDEQ